MKNRAARIVFGFIFVLLFLVGCEEDKEYTIRFDTNGGNQIASITTKSNEEIKLPDDPKKEGHIFKGWYMDENFNHEFDVDTMPKNDMTLYAKWDIKTYTVTFQDADGTILDTQTVEHDKAATPPPPPTKEDYTFNGWDGDFSHVTSDLTVKATYILNEYTVTFKDSNESIITEEIVKHGSLVQIPPTPVREGYDFSGWLHEGYEFKFSTIITQDITLIASWDEHPGPTAKTRVDLLYNLGMKYNSLTELMEEKYLDKMNRTGIMPSTGHVKMLVIPIEFQDVKHQTQYSTDYIDSRFFKGDKSLSKFYYESSYQQLDITGDVSNWVTATQNRSYYNELYNTTNSASVVYTTLFNEVLEQVLAQGYNLEDYDNDNDGFIDGIFMVHAGTRNMDVWYKGYVASYFGASTEQFAGTIPNSEYKMSYYAMVNESTLESGRTLVHETGHLLGLPDYYDRTLYDSYGNDDNIGIMGAGYYFTPISKVLLGWIEPTIISDIGEYTLKRLEDTGEVLFYNPNYDDNIFTEFYVFYYHSNYNNKGIKVTHVHLEADHLGFKYDNSSTVRSFMEVIDNKDSIFYDVGDKISNNTFQKNFFDTSEHSFNLDVLSYDDNEDAFTISIRKIPDDVAPYIVNNPFEELHNQVAPSTTILLKFNEHVIKNTPTIVLYDSNGQLMVDYISYVKIKDYTVYIDLRNLPQNTNYTLKILTNSFRDGHQNYNEEINISFTTGNFAGENQRDVIDLSETETKEDYIGVSFDDLGNIYILYCHNHKDFFVRKYASDYTFLSEYEILDHKRFYIDSRINKLIVTDTYIYVVIGNPQNIYVLDKDLNFVNHINLSKIYVQTLYKYRNIEYTWFTIDNHLYLSNVYLNKETNEAFNLLMIKPDGNYETLNVIGSFMHKTETELWFKNVEETSLTIRKYDYNFNLIEIETIDEYMGKVIQCGTEFCRFESKDDLNVVRFIYQNNLIDLPGGDSFLLINYEYMGEDENTIYIQKREQTSMGHSVETIYRINKLTNTIEGVYYLSKPYHTKVYDIHVLNDKLIVFSKGYENGDGGDIIIYEVNLI